MYDTGRFTAFEETHMTILFQRDFHQYPDAIVDLKTTNQSFLRLAEIYRRMGVKNNVFHLTLLQPELQGIDPHDPDLDEETKVRIGIECKWNIWYYLREVVRIPPTAGNTPIKFKANRGNIALMWCFLNHIDFALIQPRQTGKSVSTDSLMIWLMMFGMESSYINMITKDNDLRKKNVDRLKTIRDLLPRYLVVKDRLDTNNQETITYHALGNRYTTGVAQASESGAAKLGRGTTSPITQIDEPPFISNIGVTIPALLAAGLAAREEAKRNNMPYGNIFTTTAGKKDDRDGKYMYDMIHGGATWSERFYDAEALPDLNRIVKANCAGRKIIVNGTFSHKQLGKSDSWLREAIILTNATGEEADRDFFNRWTSGTQRSPLTPKQNDMIFNSEIEPDYVELMQKTYMFRWYIPENKLREGLDNGHFVMGLDTSEAIGADGMGLIITDVRDLSVVGAASISETNLITFAKFIAQILIAYKTITLIIERKSTGIAIIDALLIELPAAGEDPFKRMYNRVVDESLERKNEFKEICQDVRYRTPEFYAMYKKDFGFVTNAQSRALLYGNVLQNAVKNAGHLVQDKVLSSEIRGLVTKNGRIDHASSGNDDTVIAWLLTHWFVTNARRLDFYGIPANQCMVLVGGDNTEMDQASVMLRARQSRTREEIAGIMEELKVVQVGFKLAKLERRLKMLTRETKLDGGEALSFDALLKQAADARSNRLKGNKSHSKAKPFKMSNIWGRAA